MKIKKYVVVFFALFLLNGPVFANISASFVAVNTAVTTGIVLSGSQKRKYNCELLRHCIDFKGGNACFQKFKNLNCNFKKGN